MGLNAGSGGNSLSLEHLPSGVRAALVVAGAIGPVPPSPAATTAALALDLQGSKWRLGQFAPLELAEGQTIELVLAFSSDQPNRLPVPHADFFQAAPLSSPELRLNDAKVHLQVESIAGEHLRAGVTRGGTLSAHKGITYLASDFRSETMSGKDQEIIRQTKDLPGIRYAISYLRDAAEMHRYRAQLGTQAYLIAKLERVPAMAEAEQIAAEANELWVCRGDLGAEMGLPGLARAVYDFSDARARTELSCDDGWAGAGTHDVCSRTNPG